MKNHPPSSSSSASDSSLHLPRLLCLHGGGTNARIFRAQCRVLERVLTPYFRLCYAQGPFPSIPGPDVTSVYKHFGPFRAWLPPNPEDQDHPQHAAVAGATRICIRKAIAEDNRLGATGAFVGLLGFSQGAKMCASLLLAQQQQQQQQSRSRDALNDSGSDSEPDSDSIPKWRFAVLMAGRGPLISLHPEPGLHRPRRGELELVRVPTVHLHGLRDVALELHQKCLWENFDLRFASVVEWDGEHRVPIKTDDVAAVVEEIVSIARFTGVLVD